MLLLYFLLYKNIVKQKTMVILFVNSQIQIKNED